MIAEIQKDGFVHIIVESVVEEYAIKHLMAEGQDKLPVVVECYLLDESEE